MYVVNTEVFNEGMKYTDAFYVATRFCMFQRNAKHSSLRVTAEVKYVKNVNAIAKGKPIFDMIWLDMSIVSAFIEKNCNSNIEDGVNNQSKHDVTSVCDHFRMIVVRRLENHQPTVKHNKFDEDHTLKQRSRKRKDEDDDQIMVKNISPDNLGKSITGKGVFIDVAFFVGIFILLLHLYLCYKLYTIDQALYNTDQTCFHQCKKGLFVMIRFLLINLLCFSECLMNKS